MEGEGGGVCFLNGMTQSKTKINTQKRQTRLIVSIYKKKKKNDGWN